jgi:hypothetical protein
MDLNERARQTIRTSARKYARMPVELCLCVCVWVGGCSAGSVLARSYTFSESTLFRNVTV